MDLLGAIRVVGDTIALRIDYDGETFNECRLFLGDDALNVVAKVILRGKVLIVCSQFFFLSFFLSAHTGQI